LQLGVHHGRRLVIHTSFGYRFVEAANGAQARELERAVREGDLNAGKRFLNPA